MYSHDKIILTGAAGLVGQNLVALLCNNNYRRIVAIDKSEDNLTLLRQLHPEVDTVLADLADPGPWQQLFQGAKLVVLLHAQITGKSSEVFVRNNVEATRNVLKTSQRYSTPYVIHVSSSVVNSVADDDYTNTKKEQESLVMTSGLKYCILRPTLMFGLFDPKHLGWLARFMEKVPFFPIPGHGRYLRQPLYNLDFCRVLMSCMERQPDGQVFDLVGPDQIDYIDMIRTIKKVKGLKTPIVKIPYWLFYVLLKTYSVFSKSPPFTADQLKALTAGDYFTGVDMESTFGVRPTPFEFAIEETFRHPQYNRIVVRCES